MRKSVILLPALTVILGIAAFALRLWELRSAFDADTGLFQRGAPATVLLTALSAAAFALFVITAFIFSKKYAAANSYAKAYRIDGAAGILSAVALGLAWLVLAAIYCVNAARDGELTYPRLIYAVLAAMSAVSIPLLARTRAGWGGARPWGGLLWSVLPAIFCCFWLISLYRINAANPVIPEYAYAYLAIGASTFSFCYTAGFVYGKPSLGKTVFSYLITVYFCLAAIPGDLLSYPQRGFLLVFALYHLINLAALLKNLAPERNG